MNGILEIPVLAMALLGAAAESPEFRGPLLAGERVIRIQEEPAGSPYDWGPSVMFDEEAGLYRMWWCRLGGDRSKTFTRAFSTDAGTLHPLTYPDYGDRVFYAESRDGVRWNIGGEPFAGAPEEYGPDSQGPLLVMKPAESEHEFYHLGRPAVVKVDGVFYMYYEAPGDFTFHLDEKGNIIGGDEYQNQVFLAISDDGKRWRKHPDDRNPQPIVRAPEENRQPGRRRYGLGQPSVYYRDGRFVMHYVDSCTGPGDFMVRLEADNPYFRDAVRFTEKLRPAGGGNNIPDGAVSCHAQTQVRYLGNAEYLVRPAYGTGRLGLLATTTGVFTPDARANHPADVFPQLTCPDPRGGDFNERLFPTFLTNAHGEIRLENGRAVIFYSSASGFKDAIGTWDLFRCEVPREELERLETIQRTASDAVVRPHEVLIRRASPEADFSRLPRFFSSDSEYDAFANEYFLRHLSVDERGIFLGGGPILGVVDHMWVLEWDHWFFPWIDRGAMGLWRQGGSPTDVILTTLLHVPVDRHGYTWGSRLHTEQNNRTFSNAPLYGWPWPKYERNFTVDVPTGWEFNDPNDETHNGWTVRDVALAPGCPDYSLTGTVSGPSPELLSPSFDVDAFHVPILELDIAYRTKAGDDARRPVEQLRIYWETGDEPGFSDDRCVTVDFSALPPARFPEYYGNHLAERSARYPLYFPMYLHPKWGRGGTRITRLKVVPGGEEGTEIAVNYVRCTYDTRLTTANATLIIGVAQFYLWTGDDALLAQQLPRLRRALLYLNHHLKGKEKHLLDQSAFVGKDGIGNEVGHGLYGNYWDLLPGGVVDLESNVNYYRALRMMAELERVAARKGLATDKLVQVDGFEPGSVFTYDETPESLDALADAVRAAVENALWVEETGRFAKNLDVHGRLHDYGFLHHNVVATAFGLGTPKQRESILSWLDGREIPGDTAVGDDIYRWRFTPRITTRHNETWYYWAWIWERERDPDNPAFLWGNQMQDGGGVSFTSLFDLMLRCSTGRQEDIDRAFERTREIQSWFSDVRAAGGEGRDFYRAYYDGHPERGLQQSPNPGGLGLDREFLSDGSLGTLFVPLAFLGLKSEEEGILDVAPAVPSALGLIGVENVFYRGNYIRIEAGHGYVSLEGSRIDTAEDLRVRVRFRNAPHDARVWIGDQPTESAYRDGDDLCVVTPLRPVRAELRQGR